MPVLSVESDVVPNASKRSGDPRSEEEGRVRSGPIGIDVVKKGASDVRGRRSRLAPDFFGGVPYFAEKIFSRDKGIFCLPGSSQKSSKYCSIFFFLHVHVRHRPNTNFKINRRAESANIHNTHKNTGAW